MKPTISSSSSAADFRRWLASLQDTELETIIAQRPDTALPLPPGIASLATRLLLRASIARALTTCTAAELAALEALAVAGAELTPVAMDDLPEHATKGAVQALADKALVYFSESGADVAIPLEVMPALPSDWSLLDKVTVTPEAIADLPTDQRSILDTLVAGGGVGSTRDAAVDADPSRPVPQLIAAGLLTRIDAGTVRMPRAVRAALSGHTAEAIPLVPSGRLADSPQTGDDESIDQAGTAAGLEVVRSVARVCEALGQSPIVLLKDKTVGIRPLATLAKQLGFDVEETSRLIGLGFHARLIGRGEPKGGPEGNFLAPTELAETWNDQSLGERWQVLIEAWMDSPWATWESQRGLDPETAHERLTGQREHIVDVYRRATVGLSPAEFWEDLRFSHPLFASRTREETINNLRQEAEWLGLVAQGRATSVAFDAARAVDLTPPTVDKFISQADMTVLTPGPLEPELQRLVELVADLESPGLASVYRVSDASIRRGMDAGLTGDDIRAFFSEHNMGDVPQTITFLIDDVARRHGTLRSGPAMAYIRSDDESLIAQAVAVVPELRQLAPTVAIATVPVAQVLASLRDAGFAPAAEDSQGVSIDARPRPAVLPTPRAKQAREPVITPNRVAAAVAALRAADGNNATAAQPTASEPDLDLLHSAARNGRLVAIGYADKNGALKEVTAVPLSVSGGQLDATVNGRPVRFPLLRITTVELA